MTSRPPEHSQPSELDQQLREPGVTAGELLIDGLLQFYASNDAVARERRVAGVLGRLPDNETSEESTAEQPARKLGAWRMPRWMMSAAAVLALGSAVLLFILPGAPTATAEVQRVIERLRAAGDRRFEVAVNSWETGEDTLLDTIDMRTPDGLLLVRHQPPWEKEPLVVGKDAEGYWARRRDNSIDRERAERALPPWIRIEGATLFDTPLDDILERLPEKYTLEHAEPAPLTEGGPRLDRIVATRKLVHRAKPDVVTLWIDPATRDLERIEFSWQDPATRVVTDPERGPPPRGRGPRGDGDRPGPRPEEHDRPPPPDGFGPDGPRRPPPRERFDDSGPGGEGPHGPGGPNGRMGPPPHEGPRDGPRDGEGPRGDPRHDQPPRATPKSIVMQRVDVAPLPADWFTPHGQDPKSGE